MLMFEELYKTTFEIMPPYHVINISNGPISSLGFTKMVQSTIPRHPLGKKGDGSSILRKEQVARSSSIPCPLGIDESVSTTDNDICWHAV
jgi:hypothetical protein